MTCCCASVSDSQQEWYWKEEKSGKIFSALCSARELGLSPFAQKMAKFITPEAAAAQQTEEEPSFSAAFLFTVYMVAGDWWRSWSFPQNKMLHYSPFSFCSQLCFYDLHSLSLFLFIVCITPLHYQTKSTGAATK